MSRYPLRVVALALGLAAATYILGRTIRGPTAGWAGPALVAVLTLTEWERRRRKSAKGRVPGPLT